MGIIVIFIYAICGLLIVKNANADKNHKIIIEAIHRYNLRKIKNYEFNALIDYDCMEEYNQTLWRLWDWSCKNIVPPEIYAEIYPYIYENE